MDDIIYWQDLCHQIPSRSCREFNFCRYSLYPRLVGVTVAIDMHKLIIAKMVQTWGTRETRGYIH